ENVVADYESSLGSPVGLRPLGVAAHSRDEPNRRRLSDGNRAAGSLAGRRVLLAEDSPNTHRLVDYLLRKLGAEVEVCTDGQQAFERLLPGKDSQAERIDVALMDMQMPVLDGYAATMRLREAGVTTPIIALTAHSLPRDRQACMDAGCNDYLAKPFGPDAMLEKLLEWSKPAHAATTSAAIR
ncbi:MAG: response regulator, partial [Planctomycetota bacterium]